MLTLLITNHTLEINVTKNMANKSNVYYMAPNVGPFSTLETI